MAKDVTKILKREFRKLNGFTLGLFIIAFLIQAAVFILIVGKLQPGGGYLMELVIASVTLLLVAVVSFSLIDNFSKRIPKMADALFNRELVQLRAANQRAQSLRAMASKMRATLSFEVVVEEALDVCSLALEEMGIPKKSLVGAVFLYKGLHLYPVATRRFIGNDVQQGVPGQSGIIGAALAQAEITQTNNPRKDPELTRFIAFHNTVTAVCVPLRAGFNIFGAMVISSDQEVTFDEDHYDLFYAVADQAVIALQNAQLFQELESEKQRLIEADEAARKELARDLHDGPTQTIAAIAMRINFIRSLLSRDPKQALQELQKVEDMAKGTSKEIRGMLFTLRPLVLETQGLAAAIETVMKRLRENDGLNVRLVGSENAGLLDENAQSIVFSIVEEALGNARKYSKANLIEIRFWQEDNLFVVQVRDDGVGFDTADVNRDYSSRGSLGMVNMRERAERIDGSLRVESEPGRGTSVMLVVPLSKHGQRK
jgi:signal transduction histidine kinase